MAKSLLLEVEAQKLSRQARGLRLAQSEAQFGQCCEIRCHLKVNRLSVLGERQINAPQAGRLNSSQLSSQELTVRPRCIFKGMT
jgi:hypothetical protein